ncbi:MAG: DUF983 domain-containing protein [Terricaulis sp.]
MSETRAPLGLTMWRGLRLRCPQCGQRTLFRAYLKLNQSCTGCGADFSRSETADVAPYVTVMLITLLVAPTTAVLALHGESGGLAVLVASLAFTATLTLLLLPRVKGALAALLWRAQREM